MASRYILGVQCPQPVRRIIPAPTDFLVTLKQGMRIDNLAGKYYGDQLLGWLIMAANPDWRNEFEIPFGTVIRIAWPQERVWTAWQIQNVI